MNTRKKIVSVSTLKKNLQKARHRGKRVVFTNGCFDLLHLGHIDYLEKARSLGDILVLGLNSDASVRRIKGLKRPVVIEKQRAAVLAALECIDFITIFKEDTPYQLIKAIVPDILVKGADWRSQGVVGSDIVKENGGKVKLVKYLPGLSTTRLINTVIKKCKR